MTAVRASGPARLFLCLACVLVALAGMAIALGSIMRFVLWPARGMGQLVLLLIYAVAIPGQLIPTLGLVWAILLWPARTIPRLVYAGLAGWAVLSVGLLAFGLWGLILRG